MNAIASYLPTVPKPPNDPMWWQLDGRAGWHIAELQYIEQQAAILGVRPASLRLVEKPGTGRSLTETSGSFGGLTLPDNIAFGPGHNLYLLDRMNFQLKWFDPCTCEFQTIPCFGGQGTGPRQLLHPNGIGICAGNLFICDTHNNRLAVYSLHGFLLRTFWRPPAEAALSNPWEPYDIDFDGRGFAYVTDGANGCIHVFSPTGQWKTCYKGLGNVTHIAIDCQDRLYVVIEGLKTYVLRLSHTGERLDRVIHPADVAADFPSMPVQVDKAGNLYLGALCIDGRSIKNTPLVFSSAGDMVANPPAAALPEYNKTGIYYSESLDSRLYQCQWHRVVLLTQVPAGSRIKVRTFTAETDLPLEQVMNLPADAWRSQYTVESAGGMGISEEWDGLITSARGRYLWLKLEFSGNGKVTPVVEQIRLEFPRISLSRFMPAVFVEDPTGADFTDRLLSLFDTSLRSIEQKIDQQATYYDPLSTPSGNKDNKDFLSWLASWIGITLDRQWPEVKRRVYLKRAARLFHLRGTRYGLWQQLVFYLGMEADTLCCPDDQPVSRCIPGPSNCMVPQPSPCAWQPPPLILEHYQLRRWLFVGKGRLGDQAVLWGKRIVNRSQLNENAQVNQTQLITTQDPFRDPFHVYAHKFTVFVPAVFERCAQQRKALENLINREKPAHTQYELHYVEPRFRIGFQSMIGLDAVIGRYPEGVALDGAQLGTASVLGESRITRGGPSFAIGKRSQIGKTTALD